MELSTLGLIFSISVVGHVLVMSIILNVITDLLFELRLNFFAHVKGLIFNQN